MFIHHSVVVSTHSFDKTGIFPKDGWTKTIFATFENTTYRSRKRIFNDWLPSFHILTPPMSTFLHSSSHVRMQTRTHTQTQTYKSLQSQFGMQFALDSFTTTPKPCKPILGGTFHSTPLIDVGFSASSFMTKFYVNMVYSTPAHIASLFTCGTRMT